MRAVSWPTDPGPDAIGMHAAALLRTCLTLLPNSRSRLQRVDQPRVPESAALVTGRVVGLSGQGARWHPSGASLAFEGFPNLHICTHC